MFHFANETEIEPAIISDVVNQSISQSINKASKQATGRPLGGAHLPPTKVFRRLTG